MSKSKINLVLHEGAAATPVLRGGSGLTPGEVYTLTVRAVKVGRGRVVLYPQPADFSRAGHLKVTVKRGR